MFNKATGTATTHGRRRVLAPRLDDGRITATSGISLLLLLFAPGLTASSKNDTDMTKK